MEYMSTKTPPNEAYRVRLLGILREVPRVRVDARPRKRRGATGRPTDLSVTVVLGQEPWTLPVETTSLGEPRLVRGIIQRLQSALGTSDRTYGVIAAPYIGPRSQEICAEAGVGYLDLAGNCRLAFGPVFIERKGFPNPKAERRPLRTLFAPRASRILRVLLLQPKRVYQLQEVAREASVSLGLAFKVKQRLFDLEYAREEEGRIRLSQPARLLRDWAATYAGGARARLDCYADGEVAELEGALASVCTARGIPWAFTGFSGAARVAPFARSVRGAAYVDADLEAVAASLEWKLVPTGANFVLLRPVDEGVLSNAQEVGGDRVVSNVQLYLDLVRERGRGEEAAAFLLDQRLRPQW